MTWELIVGVLLFSGLGLYCSGALFVNVRSYQKRQRKRREAYAIWKEKNEAGPHINAQGILIDPKGELNDD